ncbi:GerW family sporulation protein [Salirhabdus salicampi]|uniref:GerW family sporulation protein n=1 Tax=Salirhabdus salicampi TaxID=476102 RepID=UPI0020C4C143|nr:GerW family sporulation protein [Salirhabdus salicampi]MCP8617123.1 GerW family sporulation protein [Salirhabdus salicampi]
MSDHPMQGLMTTAMENIKEMIDVNTIVGDPIETKDGKTVILPVSKVGFGFAAGGSEFQAQQSSDDSEGSGQLPFGGGSGGGVSISPVAFLIVNEKDVKMVHLDEHTHLYERILDIAPQAVEKIQDLLKDNKKDGKGKDSKKDEKENNDGPAINPS